MKQAEFLKKSIFKIIADFLKNPLYNHRMAKYVKKWNSDRPYIKRCITEDKIALENAGLSEKANRYFYWNQLINQEIAMDIKINKKVTTEDFIWLCDRRGFTVNERNYLRSMLQYLKLMK